jgi:hypothetical protein
MRSSNPSALIGHSNREWLPKKINDGIKYDQKSLIGALHDYEYNDEHTRKLNQSRTQSLAGLSARIWRKMEWEPRMVMVNAIRRANSYSSLKAALAQCWRSNVHPNGAPKGALARLLKIHLNRLRNLPKLEREELNRTLSGQGVAVEMATKQAST